MLTAEIHSTNHENLFHHPLFALLIASIVCVAAFVAALGSGYYILDDALIHQRYAENLLRHGYFTYNPGFPDHGASSKTWVAVLAVLTYFLDTGALTPKYASVAAYVALCFVIAFLAVSRRSAAGASLVVALLSPAGTRWLADGMETSFFLLLLALWIWALAEGSRGFALILASVLGLTRIEAFVIVPLVLGILMLQYSSCSASQRSALRSWIVIGIAHALLLGLQAFVIIWFFGTVLPDTAIAKKSYDAGISHFVSRIASALGAAGFFGGFLIFAWLIAAHEAARRRRLWGLTIGAFPVVPLLLIVVQGVRVDGIRHLAWAFFTPTMIGLMIGRSVLTSGAHRRVAAGIGAVILLVVAYLVDYAWVKRIFAMRSETFVDMQEAKLLGQGKVLYAKDVGFIGYFTGATVCDGHGLVNGRLHAQKTDQEREKICIEAGPDAIFLRPHEWDALRQKYDLAGQWEMRGEWAFPNRAGDDVHQLWVRVGENSTEVGQ